MHRNKILDTEVKNMMYGIASIKIQFYFLKIQTYKLKWFKKLAFTIGDF